MEFPTGGIVVDECEWLDQAGQNSKTFSKIFKQELLPFAGNRGFGLFFDDL